MFYQGDADVCTVLKFSVTPFLQTCLSIKALRCSLACSTTAIYLTVRPIITCLGL